MKRWLSFAVAVVALAATPAIATASEDTVHYGPINSGSSEPRSRSPAARSTAIAVHPVTQPINVIHGMMKSSAAARCAAVPRLVD